MHQQLRRFALDCDNRFPASPPFFWEQKLTCFSACHRSACLHTHVCVSTHTCVYLSTYIRMATIAGSPQAVALRQQQLEHEMLSSAVSGIVKTRSWPRRRPQCDGTMVEQQPQQTNMHLKCKSRAVAYDPRASHPLKYAMDFGFGIVAGNRFH